MQTGPSLVDLIAVSILILSIFAGTGWAIALAWRDHRQKKNPILHQLPSPKSYLRKKLFLSLPPSPVKVFKQLPLSEWMKVLRQVPNPLVRIALGWPLLIWRMWDLYKQNWLVRRQCKRLLVALDRDLRNVTKAWAEAVAALMAEKGKEVQGPGRDGREP